MDDMGFTGTRKGTTLLQMEMIVASLRIFKPVRFHHGCNGKADWEAHSLALDNGAQIVGHPGEKCDRTDLLAQLDYQHESKPFLTRDRDIVIDSELLLACPSGPERIRGSGTWYTIRFAKKIGVPVKIIWPNGNVDDA